jgi:hypothetical protein
MSVYLAGANIDMVVTYLITVIYDFSHQLTRHMYLSFKIAHE